MEKRLFKSHDKIVCGVLGGIGEYMEIDPTVVRIIYACLTIFTAAFPGLILYLIMAVIVPKKTIY